MALPTTDRYPFALQVAVPDDLAIEVYSLAWARDEPKSATLRAVIAAGLAALNPRSSNAEQQEYAERP